MDNISGVEIDFSYKIKTERKVEQSDDGHIIRNTIYVTDTEAFTLETSERGTTRQELIEKVEAYLAEMKERLGINPDNSES